MFLRSLPTSGDAAQDGKGIDTDTGKAQLGVPMNDLKSSLSALILARGWEETDAAAVGQATKTVYWFLSKRAVRVDRGQSKGQGGLVLLDV